MALFFANLPACTVAMESCSGSQHWARKLTQLGHHVMLIPAQHVVAYRHGAKNDRNDAAAIAEAATRPNARTVPVKTTDQLDIQTLHRVRERLVHHRTAIINELRGLLLEYGIVCAKGVTRFLIWLREEFAARVATLSPMAQETFHALRDEFRALEERLALINKRIKAVFDAHPVCRQLATIPGVGALVATAIIASVCEPQRFKNGRQARRLPRTRAPPAFNRRQAQTARHHQSGQPVSADAISARRARASSTITAQKRIRAAAGL